MFGSKVNIEKCKIQRSRRWHPAGFHLFSQRLAGGEIRSSYWFKPFRVALAPGGYWSWFESSSWYVQFNFLSAGFVLRILSSMRLVASCSFGKDGHHTHQSKFKLSIAVILSLGANIFLHYACVCAESDARRMESMPSVVGSNVDLFWHTSRWALQTSHPNCISLGCLELMGKGCTTHVWSYCRSVV